MDLAIVLFVQDIMMS